VLNVGGCLLEFRRFFELTKFQRGTDEIPHERISGNFVSFVNFVSLKLYRRNSAIRTLTMLIFLRVRQFCQFCQ
jgi:hypothetical protein